MSETPAGPAAELPATEEASKLALSFIQEQCVLFVVSSHAWTGQYSVEDAETLVGGDKMAEELLTEPRWNLIPKKWRTKMMAFGAAAQRTVRRYSIPFIVKGQYFVALTQSDECLAAIEDIKSKQREAVQEFVTQYPGMVDDLRGRMGAKFEKVAKYLPARDRVAERFYLEVIPLKVSLVEFIDARSGMGVLREVKKATYAKVMSVVSDMIEVPRQQLAAAVGNLREMIQQEKRFDERSMDVVRKKLELLKGFSFLADDQILAAMRGLDAELGKTSAQDVRQSTQVAKDLVTALSAVEVAATNDEKEGLAVRKFKRYITLA